MDTLTVEVIRRITASNKVKAATEWLLLYRICENNRTSINLVAGSEVH